MNDKIEDFEEFKDAVKQLEYLEYQQDMFYQEALDKLIVKEFDKIKSIYDASENKAALEEDMKVAREIFSKFSGQDTHLEKSVGEVENAVTKFLDEVEFLVATIESQKQEPKPENIDLINNTYDKIKELYADSNNNSDIEEVMEIAREEFSKFSGQVENKDVEEGLKGEGVGADEQHENEDIGVQKEEEPNSEESKTVEIDSSEEFEEKVNAFGMASDMQKSGFSNPNIDLNKQFDEIRNLYNVSQDKSALTANMKIACETFFDFSGSSSSNISNAFARKTNQLLSTFDKSISSENKDEASDLINKEFGRIESFYGVYKDEANLEEAMEKVRVALGFSDQVEHKDVEENLNAKGVVEEEKSENGVQTSLPKIPEVKSFWGEIFNKGLVEGIKSYAGRGDPTVTPPSVEVTTSNKDLDQTKKDENSGDNKEEQKSKSEINPPTLPVAKTIFEEIVDKGFVEGIRSYAGLGVSTETPASVELPKNNDATFDKLSTEAEETKVGNLPDSKLEKTKPAASSSVVRPPSTNPKWMVNRTKIESQPEASSSKSSPVTPNTASVTNASNPQTDQNEVVSSSVARRRIEPPLTNRTRVQPQATSPSNSVIPNTSSASNRPAWMNKNEAETQPGVSSPKSGPVTPNTTSAPLATKPAWMKPKETETQPEIPLSKIVAPPVKPVSFQDFKQRFKIETENLNSPNKTAHTDSIDRMLKLREEIKNAAEKPENAAMKKTLMDLSGKVGDENLKKSASLQNAKPQKWINGKVNKDKESISKADSSAMSKKDEPPVEPVSSIRSSGRR